MSSPGEPELKGGHPPAVKAGGMRITQHKSPHSKEDKDSKPPTNDSDVNNAGLKVSSCPPKMVSISGAPMHGNADFTVEAVQSFHEKPVPTHDYQAHSSKPNIIQQPRK